MLSDIRFSLRSLRHYPSFTAVAVLSIALGIGANSVMFSLADAMLLRPLPVPRASRVLNVREQMRGKAPGTVSYPDYLDLRSRTRTFQDLAAFSLSTFGFAPDKHTLSEMKTGLLVIGNFFDALQVAPRLGRGFRPEENAVPGRDPVVVLSDDLWRSAFGASPGVIGRSLYLNGIEFKVVGVAPESFTGTDQYFRPLLFVPLAMGPALAGNPNDTWMANRADRRLEVKGRLKDGVSTETAAAELRVIASSLAAAYPATNKDCTAVVRTELQARIDMSPWDALLVSLLLGMAVVVLLIACANVANLMLSRALSRSGEIAVRLALGASRWRLVRQLLVESLLISLAAGAAGMFLASLLLGALMPWQIPAQIPIEINARLDTRTMLYALAAAVASAVFCGLVPALRATRTNLESTLRAGGRSMAGRRRAWGRGALVVAQVAGSLFLLVCATQLYRGVSVLLSRPPGFRCEQVLMASFDASLARYNEAKAQDFYKRLRERAAQLPGAVSATVAELLPMSNLPDDQWIVPEGYKMPKGTESFHIFANIVGPDYCATLGIPVLRGRAIGLNDTATSPRVAMINEHLAKTYYPGQDPVGKRFRLGGPRGEWVEIVGVAKQSTYQFLVEPPLDAVYLPLAQNYHSRMALMVRTAGPSETVLPALRELVRSMDADQPMFAVRTMEEYFRDRATKTFALLAGFVGGMGLLGLILALSGLYAVMAWSVARRMREIGIRIAVGAGRVAVVGMVLKQGLRLSAIGVGIGLALSLLFGKALTEGMGVPSFSVPMLALVVLGLLAMAAAGAYVPARRAAQHDPITVLRQE